MTESDAIIQDLRRENEQLKDDIAWLESQLSVLIRKQNASDVIMEYLDHKAKGQKHD